jgi:integrase
MPVIKPLLTQTQVQALQKPGYHAIGGGLYLHIRSKSKAYVARIVIDGKRAWRVVGDYDRMALSIARKAVGKAGEDATNKSAALTKSAVPDFKKAAIDFIGRKESTWRNEKHRTQWCNTLAEFAYPVIGDTPCDRVTVSDVVSILDAVGDRLETRKRVRSRIENVINAAMALNCPGVPYANPASDVVIKVAAPSPKIIRKHHEAVPLADAPAVFAQIWGKARTNTTYAGLALAILTAGRTSEILGCDWAELGPDVWVLPPERMKAGREHVVPLSDPAKKVIAWRALLSGEDVQPNAGIVFPGGHSPNADSVKRLSNMALLQVMRRLMPGSTVHGWRSTFRNWCAENGVPRELAEAALAHQVSNKTEAAYLRTRLIEQRREVMEKWAAFLLG